MKVIVLYRLIEAVSHHTSFVSSPLVASRLTLTFLFFSSAAFYTQCLSLDFYNSFFLVLFSFSSPKAAATQSNSLLLDDKNPRPHSARSLTRSLPSPLVLRFISIIFSFASRRVCLLPKHEYQSAGVHSGWGGGCNSFDAFSRGSIGRL